MGELPEGGPRATNPATGWSPKDPGNGNCWGSIVTGLPNHSAYQSDI